MAGREASRVGRRLPDPGPPEARTVLLLVDVVNPLDFPGAEALTEAALAAAPRIAALKHEMARRGVPVIYANDNFGHWRSDFHQLVQRCRRGRRRPIATPPRSTGWRGRSSAACSRPGAETGGPGHAACRTRRHRTPPPDAMSPAPMNVVLISEHASPLAAAGGVDAGGQNVYVEHVARGLAAAGHRVDVLTRRDDAALPAAVEMAPRLRVHHVDAGPPCFVPKEALLPHMPAFAQAARRLPAVLAADVVHANFFMSGWVGLALQRRLGLPLVTTFHALGLVRREHQGAADTFPPERVEIERTLVRRSERLVAECPQDRADLLRLYGAAPARIASVPCGVDCTAFRPGDRDAARARLGLAAGEFIVLQLGRLVPRKGIATVVEAVARLPRTMPVKLVVVGGEAREPDPVLTPEIARLQALAQTLGVAERVHFAGRRERHELRDWYVAADVFVTTPWYEPFGITPLEAMACGTAVVGSAVGGIRHTVIDGRTGFLVPPRDPGALAARLAVLRAEPALARSFGAAGVHRVRAEFTWDKVAHELARVYAGVRRGETGWRLPAAVAARPSAGYAS